MQLQRLSLAAILALLPAAAAAQSAGPVVAAASKAMGADSLTSITYSGTARNGAFGQSKAIGVPLGPVNTTRVTQYTRTINFGTPGQLAFDGAALLGLGLWSGRTGLLVAGSVLFLSSGAVLLVWRQHLRRLDQIGEARRELRDEAEELRRLLKR